MQCHPTGREFVMGAIDLLVSLWRTPKRIVLGLFNHGKDGAIDDELHQQLNSAWIPNAHTRARCGIRSAAGQP